MQQSCSAVCHWRGWGDDSLLSEVRDVRVGAAGQWRRIVASAQREPTTAVRTSEQDRGRAVSTRTPVSTIPTGRAAVGGWTSRLAAASTVPDLWPYRDHRVPADDEHVAALHLGMPTLRHPTPIGQPIITACCIRKPGSAPAEAPGPISTEVGVTASRRPTDP